MARGIPPASRSCCSSTPADAYGLMLSAIDDPDPVIFIETIVTLFKPGTAPERHKKIPIGKANILRQGSDVTVIGYGRIIQAAADLADKLKDEVSIEVIDLRTVSPLDLETVLASVEKTGAAVVVHDAVKKFGPGGSRFLRPFTKSCSTSCVRRSSASVRNMRRFRFPSRSRRGQSPRSTNWKPRSARSHRSKS